MDLLSDRQSHERQTLTNREKLRSELILSSELSPLATIITDALHPDNGIIAINRAFEQLSGYTAAELLGRNCRLLSGEDSCSVAKAELRAAVTAGEPALVTLKNYRKNGSAFMNAVMVAPVYDDAGTLTFFVGTQMVVTGDQPQRADAKARLACLTSQQLRVLGKMAQGLRHADIATDIGLSVKTVKMHRGALVKRLGVATSTEAIRLAIEAGL